MDTNSPSEACRWQKGDVFVSHTDKNDGFVSIYSEKRIECHYSITEIVIFSPVLDPFPLPAEQD